MAVGPCVRLPRSPTQADPQPVTPNDCRTGAAKRWSDMNGRKTTCIFKVAHLIPLVSTLCSATRGLRLPLFLVALGFVVGPLASENGAADPTGRNERPRETVSVAGGIDRIEDPPRDRRVFAESIRHRVASFSFQMPSG